MRKVKIADPRVRRDREVRILIVNETDLELLETYLDGELPMSEAEGLWRRLAVEPELSAELDQLRADRADRALVWAKHEPDDAAAEAVSDRVSAAVHRRRWIEGIRRTLVYATSAAACIVVGFQIGWFERGPMMAAPMAQSGLASAQSAGVPVVIRDVNGNVIGTPVFASQRDVGQFYRDVNDLQQVSPQQDRESNQNVVPVSVEQY
jgi:anti-sigma factor RsiW